MQSVFYLALTWTTWVINFLHRIRIFRKREKACNSWYQGKRIVVKSN